MPGEDFDTERTSAARGVGAERRSHSQNSGAAQGGAKSATQDATQGATQDATQDPSQSPIVCIMGPTAAGKTDLAIDLAESMNGELVSVDSALVYRGLDIGAAKPEYPHHLIDIRDASESYSAADFVGDAVAAVNDIRARGKQPILVGGTMLYFRALLLGLDEMPESDPAVRAAIDQQARQHGWPALHAELAECDPVAAARIHPNHSQRISRALEVFRISGLPISHWQRGAGQTALGGDVLAFAVCPDDRAVLHQRIAQRFDQMLAMGVLGEVAALHARVDLHAGLPAMRAVGYRQLWTYCNGEVDLATAREKSIIATRQLAKRQLTWLRKWPELTWLATNTGGELVKVTGFFAQNYQNESNLCDFTRNVLRNYLVSRAS